MMKLIDKDILIKELKERIQKITDMPHYTFGIFGKRSGYEDVLSLLDTIEVKEINVWHLQEKENIYDAVKDWSLHTFACIMKDGTIQKFSGIMDEDYEGHINVHIDGVNDDYDNVDDIVKWIEII